MKPRKPRIKEKDFQQQVIDLARLLGWRSAHFRSVRVTRPNGSCYWQTPVQGDAEGFPDTILLRGSRLVVPELKVPPNTTTPDQEAWLAAFAAAGAETYVWEPDDFEEIKEVLR